MSVLLQQPELEPRLCDADGNGAVDRRDLRAIVRGRTRHAPPGDPRDANGDGRINGRDLRICYRECDLPRCRVVEGCGLLGIEPALALRWRRRPRA